MEITSYNSHSDGLRTTVHSLLFFSASPGQVRREEGVPAGGVDASCLE